MCDSAKCGCGGTCGGDSTSAKVKKALGATKPAKPRACVGACGRYAENGGNFEAVCEARWNRLELREWPDLSRDDQKWLDAVNGRLAQRSKRGAR